MAWAALARCNSFLGNSDEARYWSKRLAESGGNEAVAEEWLDAIDSALNRLKNLSEEE